MRERYFNDTRAFGEEGAVVLRMNACSDLARLALETCDDGLFDEATARLQVLEGAYPGLYKQWRNGVLIGPEVPEDALTDVTGLPIVD